MQSDVMLEGLSLAVADFEYGGGGCKQRNAGFL